MHVCDKVLYGTPQLLQYTTGSIYKHARYKTVHYLLGTKHTTVVLEYKWIKLYSPHYLGYLIHYYEKHSISDNK